MTEAVTTSGSEHAGTTRRLAILLAMAMFVLVVDTSLMNVSISAVVRDLHTTASGVQSAIALGGVGVRRVHPDRQQGRRSHRPQAGVRARPARLRGRRAGDGAGPEPDGDHHLLGDRGRARRLAAAARDAVPDPRQFRGRGSEEGVRARRRGGGDRRGGRTAARRIPDHVSVVARRVSARGSRDRDRAVADQAGPRRAVHGVAADRPGGRGAFGAGDGWRRARDPRVAGGRRIRRCAARGRRGRARRPGVLARAAQARGQAGADRPGPVQVAALQARDHRPDAPADRARRDDDRPADLPADGARVQRHAGRRVARAAVAEHVRGGAARRKEGGQAASEQHHPGGLRARRDRGCDRDPARPAGRLRLVPRVCRC